MEDDTTKPKGEFPSGQRGQTVNLLAVLSVVRIHFPPLKEMIDILIIPVYNYINNAGWSSLEARRAHNPKVAGSNPAPATYTLHLICGCVKCPDSSVGRAED